MRAGVRTTDAHEMKKVRPKAWPANLLLLTTKLAETKSFLPAILYCCRYGIPSLLIYANEMTTVNARRLFWYMSATFFGSISVAEAVMAALIIWKVRESQRSMGGEADKFTTQVY